MARKLTKTIKSVNIGVVKDTLNLGNYNLGEVFGSSITKSSAVTGRLINGTGSTADVTESWTITLPVPEKYRFKSLLSVIGASAGAITGGHYSSAMDENGDEVVTFIANATGASGSVANDEVVTIRWECYDDSTLHSTIFNVKCQSDNAGHYATLIVRYTEGGTLHTHILYSGDILDGPFAEVEVDDLSNPDTSCFVYYQEH